VPPRPEQLSVVEVTRAGAPVHERRSKMSKDSRFVPKETMDRSILRRMLISGATNRTLRTADEGKFYHERAR
jgi:hypothetical protein